MPKFLRSLVLFATALFAVANAALAQRESQVAPAAALDADLVAAKMLGTARDFIAARQWGDAVDLLRQIADQHGERLVAIESGRYVSVQTYVDILISSLPPEGLKLYRSRVDPQARRWFESARALRDEEGLERIARKAFMSSYGDDAALLLGDLAWEQGALARARSFWERLIPLPASPEPGEFPAFLKYPDSEVAPGIVEARLVLCSLMQGNLARGRAELEAFRRKYPEASGHLAGRSGNLAGILERLTAEARKSPASGSDAEFSTFAATAERSKVLPKEIDVGGVAWSVALREMRIERISKPDEPVFIGPFERLERAPATLPMEVLSYYPVSWKNIAFYCDDSAVYAYDLAPERGGKPAWGTDPAIFKLPPELDQSTMNSRTRVGLPRFTLSIDHGRLFTRLGTLDSPTGRNRATRPVSSVLVCLDLARQGDLAWMIKADELQGDGGKWIFDGAPVAANGKVYVTLRRGDPQLQLNIACFDASNGKLAWNRKVCGGVEPIPGDVDEICHQLLTLAEERLYYCTNLGAIASLDARDGTMRWVTTYPRVEVDTIAAFNKRQLHGPNPCVFHDGTIFAAPTDGDHLLAYDAETGILKWDRDLGGRARQLIGVSGTRLIAAGDLLFALDVETGTTLWHDGRLDPEAATCGRGVLAGDLVYWPRREEIRMVEISTGKVRRQVNLLEQHGFTGGGNVTIAGGMLLLARSDRLVAFSQFGMLKKPARDDLAQRPARKRDVSFTGVGGRGSRMGPTR